MRPPRRRPAAAAGRAAVRPAVLTAVLTVVLTVVLTAALGALPAAAQAPGTRPAGPPAGPTAVVVLGDSAASGEGAGDYEPGTRGEGGNWCHRSVHAYVHRLGVADDSVSLACSGARAADVAFGAGAEGVGAPEEAPGTGEPTVPGSRPPGGGAGDGEDSQAQRLGALAARVRVTAVLLQVGGNDEPALVPTGIACIRAFLDPEVPGCRTTLGPRLPARLAAMAPKVEAAVGDVRTALRGAGYADDDYTLVLLSYASPVSEHMPGVPAARGCPYSRPDAAWGRTVVIPALSETLAGVAARTGTRFLALDRATEGREACSRATPRDEWQRRITVDPHALVHGGLDAVGVHLAQESFHPSALGHAEIGRCVGEFLRAGNPPPTSAACRVGTDGHLHAVPRPAASADTAAA